MGGLARKKKYGVKALSEIGKLGGNALVKKYGKDYFKKIRNGEKPSKLS